jgi:signal transduction histidine kinase
MEFRRRVIERPESVTLRTRLFLLVGAAVATTVVLITWISSLSARRAFETIQRQRATVLVAQFHSEFARQADDVVRRVDRVASNEAIQRMAAEIFRRGGDYASYAGEAGPLASTQGLDVVDIVADDGRTISSAHWPARFGYRHPWATGRSPTETAFLQAIEGPQGTALALLCVRRVSVGSHGMLIAGGRRLDESFLKTLTLPPGVRAWLFRNVEPEVSSQQLIDASGPASDAAQLDPLIARVRQNGQEAAETVAWPDGPETIDAIPLRDVNGGVLAVLLLGSSGHDLAALLSRIRWSGFGVGAVALSVGFAIAYLVAARVTRPVEQLAEAARAIADGDWSVRTGDVPASGEIADLTRTFDDMARQLVDQRDRLVQVERVAAWRELARRLAHELKNPLFPLRLTVDNLRRARSLPPSEFNETFEEGLSTLSSGLANLSTVVGRFSDFAKAPAPEMGMVSPTEVIEQALQLFRARLTAPGHPPIEVRVALDPSAEPVRADPEQLGRAIQNLLINAIDAMPSGGTLTVRSERRPGTFALAVSDTGEGITDDERKRLFTPYYTTKHHGTGLGLAIVQSVVADHNGKVWVDSAPGLGTTFHIELPA